MPCVPGGVAKKNAAGAGVAVERGELVAQRSGVLALAGRDYQRTFLCGMLCAFQPGVALLDRSHTSALGNLVFRQRF